MKKRNNTSSTTPKIASPRAQNKQQADEKLARKERKLLEAQKNFTDNFPHKEMFNQDENHEIERVKEFLNAI